MMVCVSLGAGWAPAGGRRAAVMLILVHPTGQKRTDTSSATGGMAAIKAVTMPWSGINEANEDSVSG